MKNHTNPSQTIKILNYLLKGKSITPLEALSRFKCFRLASRINEIKRSGIKISKEIVSRNGKRYAKYSIANKIKAAAMLLIFVCGAVQAQHSVSYTSYSYANDYDSPVIIYGTAEINKEKDSHRRLMEAYDRSIKRSQKYTEETYQKIEHNRKMRELEDQTKELKMQTRLLNKIANQ